MRTAAAASLLKQPLELLGKPVLWFAGNELWKRVNRCTVVVEARRAVEGNVNTLFFKAWHTAWSKRICHDSQGVCDPTRPRPRQDNTAEKRPGVEALPHPAPFRKAIRGTAHWAGSGVRKTRKPLSTVRCSVFLEVVHGRTVSPTFATAEIYRRRMCGGWHARARVVMYGGLRLMQ